MFFRRRREEDEEDELLEQQEEERQERGEAEGEVEDKKKLLEGIKSLDEGGESEELIVDEDLASTLENLSMQEDVDKLKEEKEKLEAEIEELKEKEEEIRKNIAVIARQLNRMIRIKRALEEKIKELKGELGS